MAQRSKMNPIDSPPQPRRGKSRLRSASPIGRSLNKSLDRGGAGQENQSLDQHHPGAGRHLALTDAAEEGSVRAAVISVLILLLAAPLMAQAPRIALEPLASNLAMPVYLTNAHDGSNRRFIIEQAGRIRVLQP